MPALFALTADSIPHVILGFGLFLLALAAIGLHAARQGRWWSLLIAIPSAFISIIPLPGVGIESLQQALFSLIYGTTAIVALASPIVWLSRRESQHKD